MDANRREIVSAFCKAARVNRIAPADEKGPALA
jgi:hypothetical protein